jgi:transposase-like protein
MMRTCQKCDCPAFPLRRGYCHRCDMHRRAKFGYRCSYVDAEPVRAHIAVLREAGMGLRHIARVAGINRKVIQYIVRGRPERGSGPNKRVTEATSAAILAVAVPQRDRDAVAGGDLVDAVGTVRRLQALVAWGYPREHLGIQLGWQGRTSCTGNISKLMRSTRVCASTADRVDAIFRDLQLVPGWSSRARNEGAKMGWALPMEWDEDAIDDPSATVDEVSADGHSAPHQLDVHADYCSFADRYVELVDFLELSDEVIARRMGIKFESLQRRKERHQRCIELVRDEEQEAS